MLIRTNAYFNTYANAGNHIQASDVCMDEQMEDVQLAAVLKNPYLFPTRKDVV